MRKLVILGCLSYLVIGLGHVAVGSVMEQLVLKYRLDYAGGGQLITNQFLGFLAGVLLAPWLARKLGRRNAVRLSLISFAAAEIGYAFEPAWGLMLMLALLAGFGFGMGEACIGALIIELIEERKATAMSLLEVFFGVGALALPAAAAWLIALGYWRWTFGIVASVAGIVLLLWLFMPLGQAGPHLRRQPAKQGSAGARAPAAGYKRADAPLLLLGALFFAVYVGVEMSFGNYLPAILGRTAAMSETEATVSLSLFWAAMSFGRLFIGRVTRRTGYRNFLTVCCACSAAGFVLLTLMNGEAGATGTIMFTGLSMAGIFAMGLLYMNEAFPDRIDRTTSLMIACGGVGGALLPKITGWMLDRFNAVYAIWGFAACALLLLALMGLISRARGRRGLPGTALAEMQQLHH
ncbi:MFS transporter [Paenibacillus humicola]|uniref:MFS transporter n=1 Tax=Paenibacillus humicola TaxID=3110540 RepID=UPI00237BC85D|nr:MFS transporter [Paenibacillus humicola]